MADPRSELIEAGLGRVAEALGDVTQPVIDLYYARFPDSRVSFVHHSPHNPAKLEAEMVGNTLYYVMRWFENPVEARIYFDTSVPHHRVALGVSPDWYRGFIEAFLDVIEPAAEPRSPSETAACDELRDGLIGLVERNRHI